MQKHGYYYTAEYRCWASIKSRCYNEKCPAYPNYGGRGITMCSEWLDDPEAFVLWARQSGYKPELTIERRDVNKNYDPDNCTWVDRRIQAINKRAYGEVPYHGIHLRIREKRKPKYVASLTYKGVKKEIGRYTTAEEAAMARDEYIISNGLSEYPLNFP